MIEIEWIKLKNKAENIICSKLSREDFEVVRDYHLYQQETMLNMRNCGNCTNGIHTEGKVNKIKCDKCKRNDFTDSQTDQWQPID